MLNYTLLSMFLFFDTETTGLPKRWGVAATAAPNNYPDIVSIAWILTDRLGTVLSKGYHIVRPQWTIPPEASAIHNITQRLAILYGHPLDDVMRRFMADVDRADTLVAHNMSFDQNVVNNALKWRLGLVRTIDDKKLFCTMKESKNIVKIPGRFRGSFKHPKLSELYAKLFGEEPTNLHNAEQDASLMMKCYFHIWSGLPVSDATQTNEVQSPTTLVLSLG